MTPPARRPGPDRASSASHESAAQVLEGFRQSLAFELDPFQVAACEAIAEGRSVLVAAPTGSGKTVVGEFAVTLALRNGSRAFYTTPIKALSNQKYRDFAAKFGREHVGLLTGDTVINGDAPVVVMTTEVLRNMLYEASTALVGLSAVVMDEVHYLADVERGAVWEEVILHLPESVGITALSATVSNAEEFGAWLEETRGNTAVVVSEVRPVPLEQLVLTDRGLIELFAPGSGDGVNPVLLRRSVVDAQRLRSTRRSAPRRNPHGGRRRISRPTVLNELRSANLLPALLFIFSRAACDDAVGQCLSARLRLTDDPEAVRVREIVDARCAKIPDDDLAALDFHWWREGLERGLAAHHAGMLPLFKETVEELFALGLVKAVFATETLALGINMPARSVVLERMVKWNGQTHADITPGEYTQLTGRAGRRGIDDIGYSVVVWHDGLDPRHLAGLASTRTYPLRSSFRPSYNMAVNLVGRLGAEASRALLETSFAQFQADRTVVGLAAQLRKRENALAGYKNAMACELGDFAEYSRLRRKVSEIEKARQGERSAARRSAAAAELGGLRRGDIIHIQRGRRTVVAVVVEAASPADPQPCPHVLTIDRRVRRLSRDDVPHGVVATGKMPLPASFNPLSATWRHDLAVDLGRHAANLPRPTKPRATGREAANAADERSREIDQLRRLLRAHPCHGCPDREQHAQWAHRYEKLAAQIQRLRQRVGERTGNVALQFDRVCELLAERGYLVEDAVGNDGGLRTTSVARMLATLHADQDLLTAEALRAGLFDGLSPPELAALASTLVFEARMPEPTVEQPLLPNSEPLRAASHELNELATDLAEQEAAHRLDFVRLPDLGLVRAVWGWASGWPLHRILSDSDLTAGDFVRSVRQIIDLLGQVAVAAEGPANSGELADATRAAIAQLRRGVVAYSSVD